MVDLLIRMMKKVDSIVRQFGKLLFKKCKKYNVVIMIIVRIILVTMIIVKVIVRQGWER